MQSSVSSLAESDERIEVSPGSDGAARATGASSPPRPRRVAVVIPCFNRPSDLELLLADLARIPVTPGQQGRGVGPVELRAVVVDNASEPPLANVPRPQGVHIELLRLPSNTGGAGGFNAGIAYALGEMNDPAKDREPSAASDSGERTSDSEWGAVSGAWDPDFLWLVDSDARVLPDTLEALIAAMDRDPTLIAAGSAIAAPPHPTGRVFEIGGRVDRASGRFEPVVRGAAGVTEPVICDYVAACSALVRADAVRRGGLFPDVFLNGDDVEWCIRLAQRTGGRVAGIPDSIVFHPTFDRFATLPRYYVARNGFGPIDALGLGPSARFVRAMREVARAVGQAMMGRDDLARLHILGLRDAARGDIFGPSKTPLKFDAFRPLHELAAALKEVLPELPRNPTVLVHHELGIPPADEAAIEEQLAVAGPLRRSDVKLRFRPGSMLPRLIRPPADIAVIPARGRPHTWLAGRVLVLVIPGGFVIRRGGGVRTLARTAAVAAIGVRYALALGLRRRRPTPMRAAPTRRIRWPQGVPTLSVVILSYNRWPALRRTLDHLIGRCGLPASAITVVDNASTDGSPAHIAELYPDVRLLKLDKNVGVEAFNAGAATTESELVLILDDDARPDPDALAGAAALLGRRSDLAAVTLHPRHPGTGESEWPFAAAAGTGDDAWPVMGCANLVRRGDWDAAGGYEGRFFLYRNDTDLALRLLAAGRGVHFKPEWTVWHDSPAAARKSARWHHLATRNWIWTCRRHGRGVSGVLAGVLGWAWAHKLAGFSPARQVATVRGALSGVFGSVPPVRGVAPDGRHLRRLLSLQYRSRRAGRLAELLAGTQARVR